MVIKDFFIGLKKGQKLFGEIVASLVNVILLTIVYIIGVGLTYIFAKLVKKEFLEYKKNSITYWKELNLKKEPIDKYYRQF